MTPLVRALREHLLNSLEQVWPSYTVPGLWVGSNDPVTFSSAPAYFLHQLDILDTLTARKPRREWAIDDISYNVLVRHVTSYNHYQGDGGLKSQHSAREWRATGTFIKLLSILPYLRQMGVGTICLLPITDVGINGRKGTSGSPYAVKNPFRIDSNLAEQCLPMSVDDQCRVFVEMAHLLGMKVVLEVVLRTAAIDSDLIVQRPDWFYWIDEEKVKRTGKPFSMPVFTNEQLDEMEAKVKKKDFVNLPEPAAEYRELFTSPPLRILADGDGWKGIGPRSISLRIPGAFADWPADDPQPAWQDVTYYRLHEHQHYRYMAYNTIRMYEKGLDVPKHRQLALWNTIASCIPHFIRTLNIDGALIDMGHALPADLRHQVIREARSLRPDFVLFEETFDVTSKSSSYGYNAVVGYLPFDAHVPEKLKDFITQLSIAPSPVRYFAAPETHNTPRASSRAGGRSYATCAWTVLRCLPGGIPFIVAGFEVSETVPMNTGLGFEPEEAAQWPAEKLPMFSDVPLSWNGYRNEHADLHDHIVAIEQKLRGSSWWQVRSDIDSITLLESEPDVVAYIRKSAAERRGMLVYANMSDTSEMIEIDIPTSLGLISIEPSSEVSLTTAGTLLIDLKPWQTGILFTLHASRQALPLAR